MLSVALLSNGGMAKVFKKVVGSGRKTKGAACAASGHAAPLEGNLLRPQRAEHPNVNVLACVDKGGTANRKTPRMPSASELWEALGKETNLGADAPKKVLQALPKVVSAFLKERGTARIHGLCTFNKKRTKARAAQTKVICGREVALKAKDATTTVRVIVQPCLKTAMS